MTNRRDVFVAALVDWLNQRLVKPGFTVHADTHLFEHGLIDSMAILKLIAWTERELGRVIPDEQIRMDNFRTPRRVAQVFLQADAHA